MDNTTRKHFPRVEQQPGGGWCSKVNGSRAMDNYTHVTATCMAALGHRQKSHRPSRIMCHISIILY